MNRLEDYIEVGFIAKTHGFKGEIIVSFDEKLTKEVFKDNIMYLNINNRAIPFFISSMRFQNTSAYVIFEDIDTSEEASKLVSKKVLVLLSSMPKRKTGALGYKDLSGFTLIDKTIGPLGEISSVFELPQQFIASVWINDKEVMVPLNDSIVEKVDAKNKKVLVALPDGLLDIYLEG